MLIRIEDVEAQVMFWIWASVDSDTGCGAEFMFWIWASVDSNTECGAEFMFWIWESVHFTLRLSFQQQWCPHFAMNSRLVVLSSKCPSLSVV
jgi:hypothetical protein